MNYSELRERFLTVLLFTGIFLPVRLVFYTYVSQYWVGSFGLMTSILIIMLILARRQKLGYVGHLIQKHAMSFSRGRFGKFALIYLVFSIYLFSNVIYGIEHPPELKAQVVSELARNGVTDMQSATIKSRDLAWDGPLAWLGPLFSLVIILIPNKLGFAVYGILNDYMHGWMLHFTTVFLVEQLEILGLVIYFRYVYREKPINKC